MNTHYLFQHIAEELHTRIQLLNYSGDILDYFQPDMEIFDFFSYAPEQKSFFLSVTDKITPLLSSVNHDFIYATIPLENQIILLGPVKFFTYYKINHNLSIEIPGSFFDYQVNECDFDTFIRNTLLFHNLFHVHTISEKQCIEQNCSTYFDKEVEQSYSDLLFQNREEGIHHNAYSQELRMLSSIENGDIELLKSTFNENSLDQLGTLAKTFDRNYKNISISAITLISRAAIRGGVNSELAFSLCDSYIMKIEELKVLNELKPLVEGAKMRFATMVQKIRRTQKNTETRHHPLLAQSKNYIFSHLHEKITLQELAKQLNTCSNYLSELFRKYEGISFTDFVIKEKISLAKKMLIYSSYSHIEIATYLGFSSQSHLGKQFKAITGMTLKQFRDTYSFTEFHSTKSNK